MARLIDADAVRKQIDEKRPGRAYEDAWALTVLDNAPTVDAEPVVRCGECKYRYVDGDNVRFNLCLLNHNKVQSNDWYCADGERREEEHDAAD